MKWHPNHPPVPARKMRDSDRPSDSKRTSRVAIGLVVVMLALPGSRIPAASAATITVPTVTITQLPHSFDGQIVYDAVSFPTWTGGSPGTGYTSSGFTAAIANGDVITIRFEAPPGKKFVVHSPAGVYGEKFFLNTFWQAGAGGPAYEAASTMAFENFLGVAPTETYSLFTLSTNGGSVVAEKNYQVNGPFEFTAIQITFTASQQQTVGSQPFSAVCGYSVPGWGTAAPQSAQDVSLMEIVDMGATPAATTTWGRLKSLYRR